MFRSCAARLSRSLNVSVQQMTSRSLAVSAVNRGTPSTTGGAAGQLKTVTFGDVIKQYDDVLKKNNTFSQITVQEAEDVTEHREEIGRFMLELDQEYKISSAPVKLSEADKQTILQNLMGIDVSEDEKLPWKTLVDAEKYPMSDDFAYRLARAKIMPSTFLAVAMGMADAETQQVIAEMRADKITMEEGSAKLNAIAERQQKAAAQIAADKPTEGDAIEYSFVEEMWNSPEVTKKYVDFFKNPNNDGWTARNAMNDLFAHPTVPEPEVTIEILHSCRRMNDYALAVRYLESLKFLMQDDVEKIWPWYSQEIKSTLEELGILTPEEMGYDKPELYLVNPEDIH